MVPSLVGMYQEVLNQRQYHLMFKLPWKAVELAMDSIPKPIRDLNPWLSQELQKPDVTLQSRVRKTEFHPDVFEMVMVAVTRTNLRTGSAEAVELLRTEFPQLLEKFPSIADRIPGLTIENWIEVTTDVERQVLSDLLGPI